MPPCAVQARSGWLAASLRCSTCSSTDLEYTRMFSQYGAPQCVHTALATDLVHSALEGGQDRRGTTHHSDVQYA